MLFIFFSIKQSIVSAKKTFKRNKIYLFVSFICENSFVEFKYLITENCVRWRKGRCYVNSKTTASCPHKNIYLPTVRRSTPCNVSNMLVFERDCYNVLSIGYKIVFFSLYLVLNGSGMLQIFWIFAVNRIIITAVTLIAIHNKYSWN